jgi:hypothetical protein
VRGGDRLAAQGLWQAVFRRSPADETSRRRGGSGLSGCVIDAITAGRSGGGSRGR